MPKYTAELLNIIAADVVNEPWGCGDAYLRSNSESWAPYLRFLNAVVGYCKPQAVVECGVYMGTATIHMAIANEGTKVIGIDRNFHEAAVACRNYPNIWLIGGDTTEKSTYEHLKDILQDLRIGLLFLDSTHDGETPKKEFELYKDLFDEECLVVCDDLFGPAHLMEKMQEFWQWLPGEKVELHYLHPKIGDIDEPGFGVSIVRR